VNQQGAMLLGLICGALLATAFAVSAATDTAASADAHQDSPRQQNSPDEVIIAARREKLSHLRAELEKTQIAFYEEFNKINADPEYETHCRYKARVASRILERVCTPKFVDTAVEAEAEAFTRNYLDGHFHYAPPADGVILEKMPSYRKKVLELTQKDPALGKVARDYLSLTKHYESVRKEKLKGKWFVWD
jgi:hypothetical protein